MDRSGRRSYLRVVGWGSIAGFITLAAGLASLGDKAALSLPQMGWILLGGAGSTLYTSYWLRAAAKESTEIVNVGSKVDVASELLGRLDSRDRDGMLVLLARIMTICTEQAVRVAADPDLFNVLVQVCLECLHAAITRSHGTDGASLRVAVLSGRRRTNGSALGLQDLLYYPRDRTLEIELTGATAEHAGILMARQHPYENGWLRAPDDGIPAGPEGHILPPEDTGIVSYMRVGIPGVGVLLVDSWDISLSVAGRRLAAAFADVLALPYGVAAVAGQALPVQAAIGRELEEAQ